jgi:SAM-dependent methyltransferase
VKRTDKISTWYEDWFGREYLEVYSHRDEEEAVEEVDCIERLIPIADSQPVLDLACGSGRHCLELARRGYRVTGVDLSAELLDLARKNALRENLPVDFVRADMRKPPFHNCFGAVINMFTSFGYFEKDEDNAAIMSAIHRVLKPEGWFLIDYINRDSALTELVPEDRKRINGKLVTQWRRFDPVSKRLVKTIRIEHAGEVTTFFESVRLYSAEAMKAMAKSAGLTVHNLYGALDGRPRSIEAPRVILVGRKQPLQVTDHG